MGHLYCHILTIVAIQVWHHCGKETFLTQYNIILRQNGHIRKWYMIIQVSIVLSGAVDRN